MLNSRYRSKLPRLQQQAALSGGNPAPEFHSCEPALHAYSMQLECVYSSTPILYKGCEGSSVTFLHYLPPYLINSYLFYYYIIFPLSPPLSLSLLTHVSFLFFFLHPGSSSPWMTSDYYFRLPFKKIKITQTQGLSLAMNSQTKEE